MNQDDFFPSEYFFACSDLALVTALSLWYPIEGTGHSESPRKTIFYFKRDGDKLDKTIEAYWKQELKVEPQAYFVQLKIIKSRIYGEK